MKTLFVKETGLNKTSGIISVFEKCREYRYVDVATTLAEK